MATYRIDEMRQIAMGAARSILRDRGLDPVTTPLSEIEAILCDYTLDSNSKDKIFVQWINRASKRQWNLWRKDWRKWRRLQANMRRFAA